MPNLVSPTDGAKISCSDLSDSSDSSDISPTFRVGLAHLCRTELSGRSCVGPNPGAELLLVNHQEQEQNSTEVRAHWAQCSEHSHPAAELAVGTTSSGVSHAHQPHTKRCSVALPKGEALRRAQEMRDGQRWTLPAAESLRLRDKVGDWKAFTHFS